MFNHIFNHILNHIFNHELWLVSEDLDCSNNHVKEMIKGRTRHVRIS